MGAAAEVRAGAGQPASETEVREAALQFVRKISGYRHPAQANTAALDKAVDEIAAVPTLLLGSLLNRAPASSGYPA